MTEPHHYPDLNQDQSGEDSKRHPGRADQSVRRNNAISDDGLMTSETEPMSSPRSETVKCSYCGNQWHDESKGDFCPDYYLKEVIPKKVLER